MRARLKTLTTITAVLVALTAVFVAGVPARRRRPSVRSRLRRTAGATLHRLPSRGIVVGAAALLVGVGLLLHGESSPAAARAAAPAPRAAAPELRLAAASAVSTPAPVAVEPVAAPAPAPVAVAAYDPNQLIWPTHAAIWSPFGRRSRDFHTGVDLGAPSGSPIAAAQDGVVIYAGWESGYGLETRIDHGGGLTTVYAHQSKLLVAVGQHVRQGDIIGNVGSTGRVTAPHLHFEVRVNGTPQDPMRWLRNAR